MVNKVILEYLKSYKDKFPINSLKEKIVARGYPEKEFDECVDFLKKEDEKNKKYLDEVEKQEKERQEKEAQEKQKEISKKTKNLNQELLTYLRENKKSYSREILRKKAISCDYSEKDFENAWDFLEQKRETGGNFINKSANFKWVGFAAIIGIVFLVFTFVSLILGFFNISIISYFSEGQVLPILLGVVSLILFFFYYFGFYKAGKYCGSGFLKLNSLMIMLFYFLIILEFIILIVFAYSSFQPVSSIGESIILSTSSFDSVAKVLGTMIIICFCAFLIFEMLFSFSLIGLKEKLRFSFIAGLLGFIFKLVSLVVLLSSIILLVFSPTTFGGILLKVMPLFVDINLFGGNFGNFTFFGIAFLICGFILVNLILLFEALALFDCSKKFENL